MGTQSAGRAVTLQRPPVAVRHRRSTASLGDQRLRASSLRARPHCVRRLADETRHLRGYLAQVCRKQRAKRANGSRVRMNNLAGDAEPDVHVHTVSLSSACSCTPARELRAFGQQPGSLPVGPHELRAVGPHEAAVLAVVVPFRRRRPSPVRRAKGEARVLRVVDERHLSQEGMHRYRLPTARAGRTLRARRRMKGVPYKL